MPGDSSALHRKPGIELLSIIRVIGKTIGNKTIGKKFDSQRKHVADSQNFKTNKDLQEKMDEDIMQGNLLILLLLYTIR